MNATERWRRVQALFHSALDVEGENRREFLLGRCEDAPELVDDVLALLAEDATGGTLLDLGVARVADDVLDGILTTPERVGPYRIRRLLAVGGMGVVYLAEREDLDSRVAIKFLRDARLSPERRERFRREERILARLDHPDIARLYDASVLADGTPYFVMEFVDGVPLTDYCREHGLGLDARLRLFLRVAEAVGYAHRQALIHRDLKPSNILAGDATGSVRPTVKLLDFGIAKLIDTGEYDDSTPTETGLPLMTPAYASPEQLQGKTMGVATDVHALGTLLYELITGVRPFGADTHTPYEIARQVIEGERVPPSRRVRELGGAAPTFATRLGRRSWQDLDALCLTALQRDPERRYASVEALVRDVERYLDGRPLEARTDGPVYRAGKFVRRHRRSVAAAAAVALAGVALVAFYTMRLAAARDVAQAEAARTERIQRFMLDLFEGGDDVAGPSADLTVQELIDRGAREAETLGRDPVTQAALYQTLGEVSLRQAKLERAEQLLGKALERRRALVGDDHPDTAETLLALSELHRQQGNAAAAERLAREALAIVDRRLPDDDPRRSAAVGAVGQALELAADYDQAIEWLERAVTLDERRGDVEALERSLGELAEACFYAGDYERSETLGRRQLDLVAAERGTDHPAYASVLINIGGARRWQGYLDEAEALYRQALEINEAYYGRDHAVTASNLSVLGGVLVELERYDEARELLEEALHVRERVYGDAHFEVATTLNALARVELAAGRLDAAEAAFRREREIYRAQFGEAHPFTATATSNLATIAFRRGEYDTAEARMREAIRLYETALKPDHVDVAYAQIKLGQLLSAIGHDADARVALERGIAILEKQTAPQTSWLELARGELDEIAERSGG